KVEIDMHHWCVNCAFACASVALGKTKPLPTLKVTLFSDVVGSGTGQAGQERPSRLRKSGAEGSAAYRPAAECQRHRVRPILLTSFVRQSQVECILAKLDLAARTNSSD